MSFFSFTFISETFNPNNMVDLDEDQIIELLAESGETNIESLDKEYDQTENILSKIQSI